MKIKIFALMVAMLCAVCAEDSGEKEVVELPENITYESGTTLQGGYEVVDWYDDYMIILYRTKKTRVYYHHLAEEQRNFFEKRAKLMLIELKAKRKAKADALREQQRLREEEREQEIAFKKRVADAIWDKSLVVGMTPEQARESWGEPSKINSSGGIYGSSQQWIYRKRSATYYVYFDDGKLTSWQISR
jgi:hypothetical protein